MCKPPAACGLKSALVTPNLELIAMCDKILAILADVVSKTGILKSLLDVLSLDTNAVPIIITTSSTNQDSDS